MNHNKLKCYERLLNLAKRMPQIIRSLPRGTNYLTDQLNRALSSALFNLAEGNGRFSIKEKCRFFDISLGSIAEVAAAIDFTEAYGYITANEAENLKSELRIVYALIMNLKKSLKSSSEAIS